MDLCSRSAAFISGLSATSALSRIALGCPWGRVLSRALALEVAYWVVVICLAFVAGSAFHEFWVLVVYVPPLIALVWHRARLNRIS